MIHFLVDLAFVAVRRLTAVLFLLGSGGTESGSPEVRAALFGFRASAGDSPERNLREDLWAVGTCGREPRLVCSSGINIGSGCRGATRVRFSVVVPVPVVVDSGAVVIAPIPIGPRVIGNGGGGVAYRVTLGLTARVVVVFTGEGDIVLFPCNGDRFAFRCGDDRVPFPRKGDGAVFTRTGERGVFTRKGERGAFTLEGDKGVRLLLLLPPLFVFVFVGVGVRARPASLPSEAEEN